jgi:SdpC family antimicrobial peptide
MLGITPSLNLKARFYRPLVIKEMFMWRNRFWGRVAVLMVASVGLAGCSSTPLEASRAYSGEEVFKGLFFGEGEVGAKFPEIWEGQSLTDRAQTPKKKAQYEQWQANALAKVNAQDPAFLERFGEAMQSGDHVLILDTIKTNQTLMASAIDQARVAMNPVTAQDDPGGGDEGGDDSGIGDENNKKKSQPTKKAEAVAVFEFIAIKDGTDIQIATNYVVAFNFFKFFSLTPELGMTSAQVGYAGDYFIDLIARRLAH